MHVPPPPPSFPPPLPLSTAHAPCRHSPCSNLLLPGRPNLASPCRWACMGHCRTRTIVHCSGTGWVENDERSRRARGRCRPVRRPVCRCGRQRYAAVKNKIRRLRDRFLLFQLHRDVHAETIVRVRYTLSFHISPPQQTSPVPAHASLSSRLDLALWLLASVRGSGSVARLPAFKRGCTPRAGRGPHL